MDIEKLKEFIKFMDENNLCELEIEEEGTKIRLKKFLHESQTVIQIPSSQKPISSEIEKEKTKEEGLIEIKSPMVGTFYRAPSPGAKPYVEKGDRIAQGDVVCIIEAMKLMNEIKSEVSGEIVDILVENGEPVEFNQPLFLVRPA